MIQTLTLVQEGGRLLVRTARPRRLGSLFIPLRRSYMLGMPSMLLGGALVCWSFGTDWSLIFGACILGAISLYLLFDLLGRRRPLRISTLLAVTLGLAYGLGTANTWFTLPRAQETLGEFMHISTTELAYSMASIMVSVGLLLSLGELYEKPLFGEDFELKFTNRSMVFLTLGTIVLAFSFKHGTVGFMGSSGDVSGHVGYLASLTEFLDGSLLALAVCVALNIKGRFVRNYARVLSVVLFLMVFPLGRREMIYGVVLCLIGLRLGKYKIPFSPLKKIVLLCLLGGVIYLSAIGFFYLRIAGYTLLRPTLKQRVVAAARLFREKSYSDVKKEFAENVERRTFILGFLAQLEGYTATMEGGHGEDLLDQVKLAIPSLLDPTKDVFFTEEGLADQLFGANYTDEANSVLTAGAVDFGVWGVFAYPLLVVLVLRVFFEVFGETMPVFVSCFVILAACSRLLEPETTVTSYIIIFRNSIVFGSLAWFIISLPEFRIKNVGL